MKRFFYIAILAAFYLSACSGSSTEDHGHSHDEDTHTHEDGTTHADHEDHEQEEFTVTDSLTHEQMHEDSVEHDH